MQFRPEENYSTEKSFLVEEMKSFRMEVDNLNLKGLDSQKLNSMHLSGPDRIIWNKVKSETPIGREEIEKYLQSITDDKIDVAFGRPRFIFAKYLLDNTKLKELISDGQREYN